jgi:hypothetical protein
MIKNEQKQVKPKSLTSEKYKGLVKLWHGHVMHMESFENFIQDWINDLRQARKDLWQTEEKE